MKGLEREGEEGEREIKRERGTDRDGYIHTDRHRDRCGSDSQIQRRIVPF